MTKLTLTLLLILGLAGLVLAYGPGLKAVSVLAEDGAPGSVPAPHESRIKQDLEQAIAKVQPMLDRYGYAAVFLTVMVEGVGILAPGQTFLIVAAVTAAHGHLSIIWVLLCACLAAVLGNSLGYLLGRWGGRPLLAKCKVRRDRLARLEGYFTRYGRGLILLARFFDGLRQLNGIVAGMLKMPWGVFTVFNVMGAILWTGVWGLGAYWLGKEISFYHGAFRKLEPWVVGLSLIGFLALLIYLFRHRWTQNST
jgi:membrane protein DedA with SNARE-associated domain